MSATNDQLIAFGAASTRPAGQCLGFANNDVVGHFGTLGQLPTTAKIAANDLAKIGQFYETACPATTHFDFYDYEQDGIDYGHVDLHIPERGVHLADSSRITEKLNAKGTVGLYVSWGTRLGWAHIPAPSAVIDFVADPPKPAPAPAAPVPQTVGSAWAVNLPAASVQERIQVALRKRGRYQGPENGVFGENTWRGIQFTISTKNGNTYIGLINGVPGKLTCIAIQEYAKKYGGYEGPINAILGPNGWEGFARGLEKGL